MGVDFSEKVIAADDWLDTMKSYFKSQYVGEKFLIKPGWTSEISLPLDRIIIELDPGAAFGTGLHATTRLCICGLEKYLEGGMSVFDLGTGTGILSIAAAKLGAKEILAVDIDPAAVKSARQNISVNRTADRITVERGTLSKTAAKKYRDKFDIVTANITARAISDLSVYLFTILNHGGRLIASGIHKDGLDEVLIRLALAGFKLEDIDRMDKWYAVIAYKQE
jgi:ribosomal protein L11 methyltransferase